MSGRDHGNSHGSASDGLIRMFKCMRCGNLKKTYKDAAQHCMSHAKEVFINPQAKSNFPSISHYWRFSGNAKDDD